MKKLLLIASFILAGSAHAAIYECKAESGEKLLVQYNGPEVTATRIQREEQMTFKGERTRVEGGSGSVVYSYYSLLDEKASPAEYMSATVRPRGRNGFVQSKAAVYYNAKLTYLGKETYYECSWTNL